MCRFETHAMHLQWTWATVSRRTSRVLRRLINDVQAPDVLPRAFKWPMVELSYRFVSCHPVHPSLYLHRTRGRGDHDERATGQPAELGRFREGRLEERWCVH